MHLIQLYENRSLKTFKILRAYQNIAVDLKLRG